MTLRLPKLFSQPSSLVEPTLPGFDAVYYLYWYPDVRASGFDPLQHYLNHGWKEGRDPSAGFSTTGYLTSNPDVADSGHNPLWHLVNYGLSEGRKGYLKSSPQPTHLRQPSADPMMLMKLLPGPKS